MANTKNATVATEKVEATEKTEAKNNLTELVTIKLFKDNEKYKDDVFVSVNGKTWQIKRGHEVKVPRYVAMVLENSMRQDTQTAEFIERESEKFLIESKRRGM